MALVDRIAVASLPLVPAPLMRRLAQRYIAGEELVQALDRLAQLQEQGFGGVLDLLGEDVEHEAAARGVLDAYIQAAEGVQARGLDVNISVKPTHLGLRLSEDLCLDLYSALAVKCQQLGLFVRVEMEDHTTTDATLRLHAELTRANPNCGIVLQSRLHRTAEDIIGMPGEGMNVRMVKGIYLEPAEIAHVDPEPIRSAFLDGARMLLERGAFVGFATHDDELARGLINLCRELDAGPDRYEFQVLLGVRESLWQAWRSGGHPVRVYVPYGPEWRAYTQRRLRKNPQIMGHVLRATLGLGS